MRFEFISGVCHGVSVPMLLKHNCENVYPTWHVVLTKHYNIWLVSGCNNWVVKQCLQVTAWLVSKTTQSLLLAIVTEFTPWVMHVKLV